MSNFSIRRRGAIGSILRVTLALAAVLALANASAAFGDGAIEGTVTAAGTGLPVAGMGVHAFQGGTWYTAFTGPSGHYTMAGLPAHSDYEVQFYLWGSQYAPITWNAHYAWSLWDAVAVSDGATSSADATMPLACGIDAVVHRLGHPETPIPTAYLDVYCYEDMPGTAGGVAADSQGRVLIGSLPPGHWCIWLGDGSGTYGDVYYPGPTFLSPRMVVSEGTTLTSDFEMPLIVPKTTSNITPGWHKSPFQVVLTVDVDTTPVLSWYDTEGNAPSTPYIAGGLAVSGNGTRTVTYTSTAKGVPEGKNGTETVRLDGTPPTTTANVDGHSHASLVLSATDALSGMGTSFFRVDGKPAAAYAGPVPMAGSRHSVEYWSVDAVGNVEPHHFGTIVNPKAVTLGKPSAPTSVRKSHSFTVRGTVSPKLKLRKRTVQLRAYRSVAGKWVLVKTWSTRVYKSASTSKYLATVKLSAKGSWKLVAYSPGYSGRWWNTSAPRYVKVK